MSYTKSENGKIARVRRMKLKKVPAESAVFEEVSNVVLYCRFDPDGEYKNWWLIEPCGNSHPYNAYLSIICDRPDGGREVYFSDHCGRIYTYE